ncbi:MULTISPECIES: LysM peptidoglycan-binding domain-containing protein [Asticcacaulis]|uniref:LysM peptidoglycan-binding domain-containing protein n=1 Tax=Asticcacaulis TaxID=76890 RepID=UPI001AE30486|nr:LysM peptidoglycan-binding domain-containing protein [Asticcacaulis sp. BE141]
MGKALKFAVPNATTLTAYVRPAGSSGGYTAVTASQTYDLFGVPVVGGFSVDLTRPPFNAAANTSWEVKYQAIDSNGAVVDAKTGTVAFDGNKTPTVTSFVAMTDNPVVIVHSDSFQAFNAFGEVVSQTDARGNTTTFTYNAFGNLIKRTGAQVTSVSENDVASQINPVDEYYYDKSGRQIGHRDANGNLMTQVLLAGTGYGGTAGLVTTQYNPDGGSVITTYDIFGNALTVTDAIGAVTANTYDKNNRLIESKHAARTDGSRLIDTYVYDGFGQRIRHTNNVLGGAETTDYDFLGRVTKSVTFGGQTTNYNFTWNARTATGKVVAGQSGIGSWTQTTTNLAGKTATTTTDYFGKVVTSKDFGDHNYTYTYDKAGQLTQQTSSAGQSLTYTYTSSGQLGSVTDTATGIKSVFGYDRNGNRIIEGYSRTGAVGTYQNSYIIYDALNRVTEIRDANANVKFAYDANGNRRRVLTTYIDLDRLGAITYQPGNSASNPTKVQDYWYKYDSMDRFTLVKGTISGGTIVKGGTGIDITYNARGDRMSATHGSDGHVETYNYTADGYLTTVLTGGVLGAARTTDLLGRLTSYTEYKSNGSSVLSTRSISYDADNRIASETTLTYNDSGTTFTNEITNSYLSGGVDQGVLMSSVNRQYQNGSLTTTINTTNSYVWWNQAKSATSSVSGPTSGNATYSYDANGNLSQVTDAGVNRVVTYQTDSFGQVLSRKQTDNGVKGIWRNFFYLEGNVVGDVGSDGVANQLDYSQQLTTNRTNANNSTTSPYVGPSGGNFQVYQALNATTVSQSGSGYTVMAGDTLQSVAQNVWGDASLWFMLAEANGLSAGSQLVAGQSLIIPGKIANMHNASGVFKPYNATEALGNTTPTRPPEPQPPAPKRGGGCGVIGDIIATIISIVVQAVVTPIAGPQAGAAAGNVAKQAVRIAVGNQKKFNWAEVAAAAIGGHIEGQLGWIKNAKGAKDFVETTSALHSAARAVGSSLIHQGANMAFGVQKKFDWVGLAVAGVAGGVSYSFSGTASKWAGEGNKWGAAAITGTASLLAGAATRTLLTHDSFGKSLKAALPDALGTTIGNMVSDAVVSAMETGKATRSLERAGLPADANENKTSIEYVKNLRRQGASEDQIQQILRNEHTTLGLSLSDKATVGISFEEATRRGIRVVNHNAHYLNQSPEASLVDPERDSLRFKPWDNEVVDETSTGSTAHNGDIVVTGKYKVGPNGSEIIQNSFAGGGHLLAGATQLALENPDLANFAYEAAKITLTGGPVKGIAFEIAQKAGGATFDRLSGQAIEYVQNSTDQFVTQLATDKGWEIGFDIGNRPVSIGPQAFGDVSGNVSGVVANTVLGGGLAVVLVKGKSVLSILDPGSSAARMNPRDIRFTQDTVSPNFSDGGTINDAVAQLRNGAVSADDFPAIRLVEHDGKLWSLDNRRLVAFNAAQLDNIPVKTLDMSDPSVRAEFLKKFRPVNDGKNIVVVKAGDRSAARTVLRENGVYGEN